jgi:uncharacterized protein (TIGR02646 family)
MTAINKSKKSCSKVAFRYYDKYKQPDIRDSLSKMYVGLCCYCEARIGVVAYEHIEHRRPKRRFPRRTFDWRNLHLACPKCNQAKGEQWNPKHQILDATEEDKISEHLTYCFLRKSGVHYRALSKRGETTIEHTDLKRALLRENLTQIFYAALEVIQKLNEAAKNKSPDAEIVRSELHMLAAGEHGTLVQWTIDQYSNA